MTKIDENSSQLVQQQGKLIEQMHCNLLRKLGISLEGSVLMTIKHYGYGCLEEVVTKTEGHMCDH